MNYINSFKIFGEEVKQNPCIILNEAPTEATIGLVGMIAMDINSEKKDLYKCISTEDGIYTWELISSGTGTGGTSTQIVTELPEVGDENIDYILNQSGTYLYYKWIDGAWHLIAGSKAEIVNELPEQGDEFTDYYLFISDNVYTHYRWIKDNFAIIGKDTYSKTEVDNKISLLDTKISTNTKNINTLSGVVEGLQNEVNGLDKSPRLTYDVAYNDLEDENVGENNFVLYEIENEGLENEIKTVKTKFPIVGGTGTGTGSVLKIEYVETSRPPLIVTTKDKTIIEYYFSGKDSSNDDIAEGIATWKIGGSTIGTQTAIGSTDTNKVINSFDVTDYLSIGTQKVVLSIQDDAGNIVTKTWSVQKIDMRVETTFDDTIAYPLNSVIFNYTPYGAIPKTVHFILDGEALSTVKTSSSAIPMFYELPVQTHGAHLLEVYMTAEINGKTIESNHIKKDIIWYDAAEGTPVIGCIQQEFTMQQYGVENIIYTVYSPFTETPTVEIIDNEVVLATRKVEGNTDTYAYKSTDTFEEEESSRIHNIIIRCGDVEKALVVTVEKIDIDIAPVTANLVFDFNPLGRSNTDENRDWSDGDIKMTVSDNFDWVNGGYQFDKNGDQFFCIKAGTTAEINYHLFGDDAKKNGKEMKLIFKTTNVAKPDATFLKCLDNTTETDYIGIQMDAHEAFIYGAAGNLNLAYSEEDIIEFEFNISKSTEAIPMVMGYEDGVSTRPMVYDDTYNFEQNTKQTISLGSNDCDLHIYRFKVYNASLSDRNILNNFIADARNVEEMISRYNRNQIYNDEGLLTPESVAERCPWLRVYKLSAPYFTNNKSDKVPNTVIQQIYKNGDPVLDNWTCYNAQHSGQGTSSNNYGAAGRNLDFIMNKSGIEGVNPYFQLGDNTQTDKITLTRTSVPVAYLNAKVNIASSNNLTNAMLARRYNEFNPYNRPFIREANLLDVYTEEEVAQMTEEERSTKLAELQEKVNSEISYIKDTMEFYNCVIFIQETDDDLSTHREFADKEWHFYAIGNIGDSKKTDNTRLTDINDKYECCVEIMDVKLPLSDFPVDTMYNAMGYEEDETTHEKEYIWAKNENLDILYEKINGEYILTQDTEVDLSKTYYVDILEHDDFSEDFTYGWRYIYKDGTDEENAEVFDYCKQKWIELYRFITTSTDEEFKSQFGDYFVTNTALYNYLFTTRYCMVDNRAKNTFWHYSKTGEVDNKGNPIRKWDLSWGYDMDTSLGLNNYGKQVYRYGLEDIDKDEKGEEIFRESDSTFFCRVRDLFSNELKTMYNDLESKNAWHAESFLNNADNWQSQFPEELWRIDIERKYIRTYNSSFINGQGHAEFLTNMANGKMKYHRRQWERSQEKYMASKYQSSVAKNDNSVFRCSVPEGDLVVQPNYRLKLTPYAYMYLNVAYGTQSPIQLRAEPNITYEIPFEGTKADIVNVYSASLIQDFGDLSSCYVATADTSKATKVKKLIFGNDTVGYKNPNFETLTTGANHLLEILNIENVTGLKSSLNLSALGNLRELYAHGSGITGVIFANGGKISIAELPAVGSITMKNLLYLETLDITDLNKLTALIAENCDTVDLVAILNSAPAVNRARITDVNWTLEDTELLEKLYNMSGFDNDGYNTEYSILTGQIYIDGDLKASQLEKYETRWGNELVITYKNLIPQWTVTYKNYDGTVLYSVPTDAETYAIEPISKLNYPTPEKPSDEQYVYSFSHWTDGENIVSADESAVLVTKNTELTAIYTGTLQKYDIKWYSEGVKLYEVLGAEYGTSVSFDYDQVEFEKAQFAQNLITGYYTAKIFSGWDKSTGFITRDTEGSNEIIVNAIWQESSSNTLPDKTEEMTPTDIYLISKMNPDRFEIGDQIELTLGHDYNFKNVESTELIKANDSKYFSYSAGEGTEPIDTGIKLFDENSGSFTLALDFECFTFEKNGTSLMYINDGTNNPLLSLTDLGNNRIGIRWLGKFYVLNTGQCREMVVLKYIKEKQGSEQNKKLYIYTSSSSTRGNVLLYNEEYVYHIMTADQEPPIIDSSLILGGAKTTDGIYTNGAGILHWCKIWYNVLEEENLINLARWSRQKLIMDYCGSNKYHLPGSQETCKLSFICNTVLGKKQIVMNSSEATNAGGWPETMLEDFYNNRLFKALPYSWRNTLSLVEIVSTVGQGSYNITTVNNYIYEPSYSEYYYSLEAQNAPYNQEGTLIENYNSGEPKERVKFLYPKLNGQYSIFKQLYEPTGQGKIVKDGDLWLKYNDSGTVVASVLMWVSQENIDKYSLTFSNKPIQGEGGVWIWPETWWLRSPYYSQTDDQRNTSFKIAYSSSTQAQLSASSRAYLCPCFSI